jgi:pimeloyl-ACP methyl ester carboxylesterase
MTTRIQPQDKYVAANGINLHYLEWGTPAMVLLHGLRGHAHSWDNFSEAMCGDYHVLAFDQRGRGYSDWAPDGDYSREAFVADLTGICDGLNLESITLIGHSLGTRNAIPFASRYPKRVRKVVFVDMTPGNAANGERLRQEIVNVPEEFDSFEDAYSHIRKENQRPPEDVLRRRVKYQTKELPNGKIGWRYDIAIRDAWRKTTIGGSAEDLWPDYRKIDCPILVVRGMETDALLGDEAHRMLEANANAKLVEIPNAHHMVFEDNPDAFLNAVRDWLKK